ncbi:MAG: universal stress protein [Candidatus Methylomirabilota bacterium]|nr:universal stress protein [Candidatus Methylomirabilis sp.]NJD68897.1 universal stress protein [candidate division NC10 bacterium]PWB46207.1 MAG: universal stress protein [candidate division NC10 bacterium]
MQISRILFPTDFSHDAEHAFQYALTFAREFGAELHLLHVIYFPPQTPEYDIGQVIDSLVKNAEDNLKKLAEGVPEPKSVFRLDVQVGVEHVEITKYAEREKIDLIVMGTRGRTGLAHVFLGSVAERVVRHASCPVLTVKLPPRRGGEDAKEEAAT